MSKTIINFILDTILALTIVGLLWTGAMLQYIFPPASDALGWSLWGWNYDEWAAFHFYFLFVFAVLSATVFVG